MKIILIPIIERNNKEILLIKRNRPPFSDSWALSGGHGALDKEEDINKAVILEVKQDFGVNFSGDPYYFRYKRQPEPALNLYWLGKVTGEPMIKSVNSIKEIRWFDIEEVTKMDLGFDDKTVINKLFNDLQKR